MNWSAPVELTREVDPASLNVTNTIFAQACNADRCLAPKTYSFTAKISQAATRSHAHQSVDLQAVPPSGDGGYENAASSQSVDLAPPVELPTPADTPARSASKGPAEISSLAHWTTAASSSKAD